MSNAVFNAYSRYYDLLYRDKDYVAEAEYIAGLLERFGVSGKRLLEFGSGTGKHGRLLAQRGYEVTGIERSAEMVVQAEAASGFSCQQGDICTVQLGQTFDAVLSLFHVVSYQTTNNAVQAVFARAAEHLEAGGLFVFDVWYSAAVYAQKPEVRVKRMADEAIEITRVAEPALHPNENRVDVNYTIFARDLASGAVETMTETHPMRHFSLPELYLLAKMSGFAVVGTEEFLTGKKPSEETWGVCLILKKVI
jgi:SAM-dependent methyltransferase